jgi:signal transduction histidine kinase
MPHVVTRLFASRSALVVALLTLAVIAAGVLSWEAVASARRARITAERVLRDYAGFAATQFVREVEVRLDARLANSLMAARHAVDAHPPDPNILPRQGGPARMRQPADDCNCPSGPAVRTTFAVSASGPLDVQGEPLDQSIAAELAAAVTGRDDAGRSSLRLLDNGVVVTALGRRRGELVLLGVVAADSYLTDVFSRVLRDAALLPGSLVTATSARKMLGVRVLDAAGRERFTANQESSPFTGSAALDARFGTLRAEVAIPSRAASMLVIGGLPSERWPLVIGLLLLSSGLVVAAVVQLRREMRFARQRADFVSGVSHELRTPLAQIRLFGETLLLGRVRSRDEERRAAEIIVQEARRLSQMVDNVLLFSRSGRTLPQLKREPVHVTPLVGEIVDTFRPQAASKQTALVLETAGHSGPRSIDPNALRQMLLNLLDNAVKYGPRGQTVRVGVTCEPARIRITVEDEGPGVAGEDRARIWEPFWRASGSAEGGTGLGLAIVRELSTQHGGSATVEATAAGGACFVLHLDAPPAADDPLTAPDPARQPA